MNKTLRHLVRAGTVGATLLLSGSAFGQELTEVRIGLSPFQDMLSVQVGYDLGFYEQVGLDLQIVNIPWETATETLAAGQVDLTGTCETTIFTTWDSFPDQRLAIVFYTFEGSALMVRADSGMKSYTDLLAELGDREAALTAAIAQLKGKTVVSTKGTDMEMGVAAALLAGGLAMGDITFFDMNPDDGLAAFLSGTGDAFLGGLPQRFRLAKEGATTLITAQQVGSEAVIQCGFVVTDAYLQENRDTLVKFLHGTYLTLQYVDSKQEIAFSKIAELLNSMTGAQMTVEDLKGLWNNIEFFPATGAEAYWLIASPEGERYFRPRLEFVKSFYMDQGLLKTDVDVEEIFAFKDVLAAYLQEYEPDAWALIQAGIN